MGHIPEYGLKHGPTEFKLHNSNTVLVAQVSAHSHITATVGAPSSPEEFRFSTAAIFHVNSVFKDFGDTFFVNINKQKHLLVFYKPFPLISRLNILCTLKHTHNTHWFRSYCLLTHVVAQSSSLKLKPATLHLKSLFVPYHLKPGAIGNVINMGKRTAVFCIAMILCLGMWSLTHRYKFMDVQSAIGSYDIV